MDLLDQRVKTMLIVAEEQILASLKKAGCLLQEVFRELARLQE